jgi:spore maturation protein CgeB
MYPGYLKRFYENFPDTLNKSYTDHYDLLISDSTEFVASYTRTLSRLGIKAIAIIANDILLQKKWKIKYYTKNSSEKNLIYQQINHYKPDILWIEDLRFVNEDLINYVRQRISSIKLIIAYHCAPWNSNILKKLKACDMVITCTPGLQEEFENEGIKAYLVYHGFDKELLPRIRGERKSQSIEVLFSGSLFQGKGYHNSRIDFIKHLLENGINLSLFINIESKYRIIIKKFLYTINQFLRKIRIENSEKVFKLLEYGNVLVNYYPESILKKVQKPEYGFNMYKLLQNSKIVLNNHGEVAGDYAGNMRLFEATGAGSCLLTDDKCNLTKLFDVNNEIVVYHDAADCADKIKWLLENEEARKAIALAGQNKTLRSHTVEDRCKSIIEIIRKELTVRGFQNGILQV